ncbi:unnamed protein product [Rhizoctonia solani]|uniref:NAD(P)-binding protein n=1 Tax=Rhizoctonia solani TaxID=456999 RepID=A0A8H3BV93_9AGAM|nr:unnamed protein product [Rhizoctonia solani]CAE7172640.1 unnamed protein product [Rhizoctonia solani]
MPVSYAITGASRGLGYEFVNQLSANPDNIVFALARNPDSANKLRDLQAERKNVHIVKMDITNLQEIKDAAKYVSETTGGKLDWLINNAVHYVPNTLALSPHEYPVEALASDFGASFEGNVTAVAQTINTFLPLLRAGNHKKVISLSSGMADEDFTRASGAALSVPYSISKYALNLLMLKYAMGLKDEGFIFLTISPGVANTHEGPPPPPEILSGMLKLVEHIKIAHPPFEGPATAESSVKHMLNVFNQLKPEHSGNFCSHLGPTSKQWL